MENFNKEYAMLTALKDLITSIVTITLLAYATGQQEWLWKQIASLRHESIKNSRQDWGCPSIFQKTACKPPRH